MKSRPFELCLIWQNIETRQRYHVGRLIYKDGNYTFSYETKGYRRKLKEAIENGYRPHLAFPDIHKTYRRFLVHLHVVYLIFEDQIILVTGFRTFIGINRNGLITGHWWYSSNGFI